MMTTTKTMIIMIMIIMVMLIIMMNMLLVLLIIETTESFKTMIAKVQEHSRKNSEWGLMIDQNFYQIEMERCSLVGLHLQSGFIY